MELDLINEFSKAEGLNCVINKASVSDIYLIDICVACIYLRVLKTDLGKRIISITGHSVNIDQRIEEKASNPSELKSVFTKIKEKLNHE